MFGTKRWAAIARCLPGRNGKQCRERWCNHQDSQISRDARNDIEDMMLYWAHERFGNNWEISKLLPGRSDNGIKNRWNTSVRKRSKELAECTKFFDMQNPELLPAAASAQEDFNVGRDDPVLPASTRLNSQVGKDCQVRPDGSRPGCPGLKPSVFLDTVDTTRGPSDASESDSPDAYDSSNPYRNTDTDPGTGSYSDCESQEHASPPRKRRKFEDGDDGKDPIYNTDGDDGEDPIHDEDYVTLVITPSHMTEPCPVTEEFASELFGMAFIRGVISIDYDLMYQGVSYPLTFHIEHCQFVSGWQTLITGGGVQIGDEIQFRCIRP